MKFLIDARPLIDPAQGGVTRVARGIVEAYARSYPTDDIICFTTGARKPMLPTELSCLPHVRHLHLGLPNKIWSTLSMFKLVSMATATERRVGKIDAIFLPNVGFVGDLKHRGYTLLIHDLSFLIEPRWFTRWQRIWHRAVRAQELITHAKTIFSVSETTKRDAIRILGIPEEKIRVIPPGSTPINRIIPTKAGLKIIPNKYILALGSGAARKNTPTAIEAVRALRQEPGFEDIELILTGASPRNPAPWIHAMTRPTDQELAELYAHARAFLYPSWYEGYGLPLHEAMSHGTPCIASTSGVLPESAPKGTIFAHPAKPHQWVDALKIALSRPRPPKLAQPSDWAAIAEVLRAANH